MLAHVADQNHFVCYGIEAGKEFVEVLCTLSELIEHKDVSPVPSFPSPANKHLEGFGLDSALLKLLRGACGERKTAHLITFLFGCFPYPGKGRGLPVPAPPCRPSTRSVLDKIALSSPSADSRLVCAADARLCR